MWSSTAGAGGRGRGSPRSSPWRTSPAGADAAQFTVTSLFHRPAPEEQLVWTGNVPVRLSRALQDHGLSMAELLAQDGRATVPEPMALR